MRIWTVDAFTDVPFKGNPAAVTLVNEFPEEDVCLQISSELNLSETSFLKPLSENRYRIRWFTPKTEVKLCGHATLAAAHILFSEGLIEGETIFFDSLSGPLEVRQKERGRYTLDFPLQPIGSPLSLELFRKIFGPRVKAVVQAFDDVIVEVEDFEDLKAGIFDSSKIEEIEARGVILTAIGDERYDFYSRFFAPRVGVPEDLVTGSAHCKLADYWRKKLGKEQFKAYQASRRGGELTLEIQGDRLHITGSAVTMITGNLPLSYSMKTRLSHAF